MYYIKGKRKEGRPGTTWKSVLFDRVFKTIKQYRNRLVFMLSLWGRHENKHEIRKKENHRKLTICYGVSCSPKAHFNCSNCYKLLCKSSIFCANILLYAWLNLEEIMNLLARFYICNESLLIKFCFLHKNTFLIKLP